MGRIELIQIAILWSITGLALISAVNARGVLRSPLSWLFAAAIALIAVFFTYLKSASVQNDLSFSERRAPIEVRPKSDSVNSSDSFFALQPPASSPQGNSITASQYSNAIGAAAKSALEVSDLILSFPKWDSVFGLSLGEREKLESRALSLRNRSADIYRTIRTLNPPPSERSSHDLLLAAADNLRLAGYEIHQQFGLEQENANAVKRAEAAHAVFGQLKDN